MNGFGVKRRIKKQSDKRTEVISKDLHFVVPNKEILR